MKLLFDENLSDKVVQRVIDLFPESTHVKSVGLEQADDGVIAQWATKHGFTLVSKDTDFYQRCIANGCPPKFVWLRIGNCPTAEITNLLKAKAKIIREFAESETESILVLER